MALRRFSDNPAAGALTGAEIIPGLQSGADVQMTAQDIADLAGGVWGSITGTLSAQTDLQAALDAKAQDRRTVTAAASTSGVLAIDCGLGDYFTHALDENVTSWNFTNLPGSGKGASLMIRITQDATPRTVAWPASFKWAGGIPGAVSTAAGAIDLLAITTFDNGTTWRATLAKAFA